MENQEQKEEFAIQEHFSESSDLLTSSDFRDFDKFEEFQIEGIEKAEKIADRALKFFLRHVGWYVFVETIMMILAAIGGLLQSLFLLVPFQEDISLASVFKTVIFTALLVVFSIFAMVSYGIVLIIPFYLILVYSLHSHIFRKLNTHSPDFDTSSVMRFVRRQEFDSSNFKKLAAIYIFMITMILIVGFFSFIGVTIAHSSKIQLSFGSLNVDFYEWFLTLFYFVMYYLLNPLLKLGLSIIYVKNLHGNTLRSISRVYQHYFREVWFVNLGYTFSNYLLVLVIPMMVNNFIKTDLETMVKIADIVGLVVILQLESTFWVMFVKSRLPEIRVLIEDADVAETKMFAMGTSAEGETIRSLTKFEDKTKEDYKSDLIKKDEDVWGVELDVIDENETVETVDESKENVE